MYSRTAPNRLPYMRERGPMRPVETFSNALRHYKSLRVERAASVSRKEDVQTERKSTHQGAVGPSTDLTVIADRLSELALPYWREGPQVKQARMKLAGVIALTLGTTGVSVLFSYLGRDFFNALSAKDQAKFTEMLFKWLGALCLGIPVFVLRDYYQSKLALDWREWMTEKLTAEYFEKRKFYKIQSSALLDNPDQRIAVDVGSFTNTTLSFVMTMLNAAVDLVSFSGILFTIYPPLFVALLIYSVGGTVASIAIGRPLIGLNFLQEAAEADFRYGLVRVRENAESIAFYGGEGKEENLLGSRLKSLVINYGNLLLASRRLSFFTSFYRFLIQILPAAVVAPLYFRGEIEFGVVNQSASAFNHILSDISLVVFQFEALAGFSAVIDRLGELKEVFSECENESVEIDADSEISVLNSEPRIDLQVLPRSLPHLLDIESLTLCVPRNPKDVLIRSLDLNVSETHSLLVMGPSGSGKTSLLRTIAGLWQSGKGAIRLYGSPVGQKKGDGQIFFVPQRPYVVLGTLRDQLLYPTWSTSEEVQASMHENMPSREASNTQGRRLPTDAEIREALHAVQLTKLLDRLDGDLDFLADWAAELSLGEQQRLAFARVLLTKPDLVLMDESTSALDTRNERLLYKLLKDANITFISVGHRPTLLKYHENVLVLAGDAAGSWELMPSTRLTLDRAVEFVE